MLELTNITIREDDLNAAISVMETMLKKSPDTYFQAAHDRLQEAWWKMELDKTYVLCEEPF